nr:NAD-dependent epimerase/dehydratase family protein [Micromonospora sp. DSM 115978]
MRVLVTGGLGFLGHAVTRQLLDGGHRVTVLTSRHAAAGAPAGVAVVAADLRDRAGLTEALRTEQFDAVCHLAAVTSGRDSFADPLNYFDVNTTGTVNLLRALADPGADRTGLPPAFVLVSTNIVYGSRHAGALTEDLDPYPDSPYAASKLAAEQVVAAYAATGAIGAVILRPFNVAGAVDGVGDTDPGRIIPNVFRAMTGKLPHVTLNGDGSAVRDFVHVADAAAAVALALGRCKPGGHEVFNVGSGVGVSMSGVLAAAERVTGRTVQVRRMPPRTEPAKLTADTTRSRELLGWRPRRSTLDRILTDAWRAWR